MKPRHTPHANEQTMSSYLKNTAAPFDEKGGNYFSFSGRANRLWKYRWQHFVTVHKIVIGGTLNVLNHIQCTLAEKFWVPVV
jgi:hypothetical protein